MNARLLASVLCVALSGGCTATRAEGPWPDLPGGGQPFRTFFVTWTDNGSPEMFDYLRRARPEVVQVGFYGPMFHGYAHHEKSTGYPMQLPVSGEREALARQTEINRQVHEILPESKVIGHFQLCNVVENPDPGAAFGFIKWYDELWDKDLLGGKPVADVRELLQRDADGKVIKGGGYIDFIGLCLSSPHTQEMLRRMVKIAVDAGVDGLVSNYNYRWGCACHWCQDEFRAYLRERYDVPALRDKFGIDNLDTHVFAAIPARIPGYPKAEEATELHWAAMDWGNRHFKRVFDEVYIKYGRSLKPGFVVGTWNHLGLVGHTEERALLPTELWGVGEDYFWYSGSHGPPKLAEHKCGDAWLNLLWLREMANGKPFMMGKYEGMQVRASFAEASATGGAGTGLYHPFKDPVGAEAMARHLNFVHDHADLYGDATPYAEIGLLLPRRSVLSRRPEALDAFRRAGVALAEAQVLFDVVLDERLSDQRLRGYRALVVPPIVSLSTEQQSAIDRFATFAGGGRTILLDANADDRIEHLASDGSLSGVDGPWTLRAAAFDRPGGRTLHLVNYNRDEAAAEAQKKTGPAAEMPSPERDIAARLALPRGATVESVTLLSPDADRPVSLTYQVRDEMVHFTVPEVVVYGVIDVRFR